MYCVKKYKSICMYLILWGHHISINLNLKKKNKQTNHLAEWLPTCVCVYVSAVTNPRTCNLPGTFDSDSMPTLCMSQVPIMFVPFCSRHHFQLLFICVIFFDILELWIWFYTRRHNNKTGERAKSKKKNNFISNYVGTIVASIHKQTNIHTHKYRWK